MTLLHQAAQKAVEALTDILQPECGCGTCVQTREVIASLRAALQQQPEPVGFIRPDTPGRYAFVNFYEARNLALAWEAVYRCAPPALQQQEVPSPVAARDSAGVPAGEFGGLSPKQAWWAGYRVGKGLPPDMPRSEAVAAEPGWWQEAASPSTTRQQEAVTIATLRQHWLSAMECDHDTGRDKPHCACSRVDLGWHPSVGAAVEAWLTHVSEAHARQQEAGSTDEWKNEAATVLARFISLSVQPPAEEWARTASAAIRLLNDPAGLPAAPSTPENAGGVTVPDGGCDA